MGLPTDEATVGATSVVPGCGDRPERSPCVSNPGAVGDALCYIRIRIPLQVDVAPGGKQREERTGMKKSSAALMMLALAIICLAVHFGLGWQAFQNEAQKHNLEAVSSEYLIEWGRDVFENLQSEFIQLFFQFLLLAGLFKFIGVQVFEEDQEEVKQRLGQIETRLDSALSRSATSR
jgi:hypothetical protein